MKLRSYLPTRFALWLAVAISGLLIVGCEKEYKLELPLAVNQTDLNLESTAGSTHVLVYSTGDWSVSFLEDTSWASIAQSSGDGNGEFIFKYDQNIGINRSTDVVLRMGSREKVITFNQYGPVEEAQILFGLDYVEMPRWAGSINIPFSTNLSQALECLKYEIEYLDTEGNVVVEEFEPWLSNIEIQAESVSCDIAANAGNDVHNARLTVYAEDRINNIVYSSSTIISQSTEDGYITFPSDEIMCKPYRMMNTIPWQTNLGMMLDNIKTLVVYDLGGEEWISNITCTNNAVSFDTAENTTEGLIRKATIMLTYEDDNGHTLTAEKEIAQNKPIVVVPFTDIRNLLPAAAQITLKEEDGLLTGVIIGGGGRANLETNPHTAWNQVDYTVNSTTNYMQDLNATYGFRLQTKDAAVNDLLTRFAVVELSLDGLTLTREDNPIRYTLSGITADHILDNAPGSATSVKRNEKYISELTDEDMYTYTALKDCEFAIDYGAYGNFRSDLLMNSNLITNGSTGETRCDCCPRILRDIHGARINMLINSQTPWCRIGKDVQHGSGTINGILVHSELSRWGGDIGRYQIRPIDLTDIEFSDDENSGFSQKIAVWYFPNGASDWTLDTRISSRKGRVLAKTGSGWMDCSLNVKPNQTPSFADLTFNENNAKAIRYAPSSSGAWYNTSTNTGAYITWNFSTEGISGTDRHLVLTFTAGGGSTASLFSTPIYWNVFYSIDGKNFTELEQVTISPAPSQNYQWMNLPGTLQELVIDLPDALLNQKSVTIRLQAASNESVDYKTGQKTNAQTGALYFRFGAITVKYNK